MLKWTFATLSSHVTTVPKLKAAIIEVFTSLLDLLDLLKAPKICVSHCASRNDTEQQFLCTDHHCSVYTVPHPKICAVHHLAWVVGCFMNSYELSNTNVRSKIQKSYMVIPVCTGNTVPAPWQCCRLLCWWLQAAGGYFHGLTKWGNPGRLLRNHWPSICGAYYALLIGAGEWQ